MALRGDEPRGCSQHAGGQECADRQDGHQPRAGEGRWGATGRCGSGEPALLRRPADLDGLGLGPAQPVGEQRRLVGADDQPQRLARRSVEPRERELRSRGSSRRVAGQRLRRRLAPGLREPGSQRLQGSAPGGRPGDLPGDAPPGQCARGIHIGGGGHGAAVDHLRCHEPLGADGLPRRLADEPGDPEVGQQRTTRAFEQDVARGDVAVHHPGRVQSGECLRDRGQHRHRLPHAEGPAGGEHALQRPAADVVQDQRDPAVLSRQRHGLVEAHQPLDVDARQHPELADRCVGLLPCADGDDLDRHRRAVAVPGAGPHHGAAAGPQPRAERIPGHHRRHRLVRWEVVAQVHSPSVATTP